MILRRALAALLFSTVLVGLVFAQSGGPTGPGSPLPASQGGTGVNNGVNTLTLGGALNLTHLSTPSNILTFTNTDALAFAAVNSSTNNALSSQRAATVTNTINESSGIHPNGFTVFIGDTSGNSGNHITGIESQITTNNSPATAYNGIYGFVAGLTSNVAGIFGGDAFAFRAEANSNAVWKTAFGAYDGCCTSGLEIGASALTGTSISSQNLQFDAWNSSGTKISNYMNMLSTGAIAFTINGGTAAGALCVSPTSSCKSGGSYGWLTLDGTGGIVSLTSSGTEEARLQADTSGLSINSLHNPTNINASNNEPTNIGTGTTTSAVTIGGPSNTVALNAATTIGVGSAITSSGPGGALTANAFSSSTFFSTAGTGLGSSGATVSSNATDHISYQPGLLTAVNATKAAFHKFSKASTVDNIEGSAATFSCVSNPTVTVFECGTSTTCATPTTIGTVTVTAAGTVVDGTVSNSAITAGDYVAFAMTAGTCASVDIAATVQTHQN